MLPLLQLTDDPAEAGTRRPVRPSPRFIEFQGVDGGETTYYVYVEQKVLCELKQFPKALIVWFVCHYIFNLEYAKPVKDVCLFFQEFIFDLVDTSKKTSTYLTVSSGIMAFCT